MRRSVSLTRLAMAVAVVLWAPVALATPVELHIQSGSDYGFGYSTLHSAESSCSWMNGTKLCKNGYRKYDLTGTLYAHLDESNNSLSGIHGTIWANKKYSIKVSDGHVDFGSSSYGEYGAELDTTQGTFSFLDYGFAGPANSFDGETLRIWGNNWANTGRPDTHGYKRWGMDLGAKVWKPGASIPEPGAFALFGAGSLLVSTRMRRRQ